VGWGRRRGVGSEERVGWGEGKKLRLEKDRGGYVCRVLAGGDGDVGEGGVRGRVGRREGRRTRLWGGVGGRQWRRCVGGGGWRWGQKGVRQGKRGGGVRLDRLKGYEIGKGEGRGGRKEGYTTRTNNGEKSTREGTPTPLIGSEWGFQK